MLVLVSVLRCKNCFGRPLTVPVDVHGDPVEEHGVQDGGADPRPEHLQVE